jgi:hypothetical protein
MTMRHVTQTAGAIANPKMNTTHVHEGLWNKIGMDERMVKVAFVGLAVSKSVIIGLPMPTMLGNNLCLKFLIFEALWNSNA